MFKEAPMNMPDRYVYTDFHIDTNRINSKANLRYMNILEHLDKEGVIYVEMAEVAQEEQIQKRDERAKRISIKFGKELPEWIGKDLDILWKLAP
jgi:tRNA A37 threonylcarbamoyladenosine biosynthesis protein TsaE